MSDSANYSNPVEQAILGHLAKLPLKWQQVDNDNMTAAEQEALKLLTATGPGQSHLISDRQGVGWLAGLPSIRRWAFGDMVVDKVEMIA